MAKEKRYFDELDLWDPELRYQLWTIAIAEQFADAIELESSPDEKEVDEEN